jgi:hypothetical protein
MTYEQQNAREWISLYEGGSTLTCDMRGSTLWIESETGDQWTVYPEGRIVRNIDEWTTDLIDLENRVLCPEDYKVCDDDLRPEDRSDYAVDDLMGLGAITDFHADRLGELQEQARWNREDDEVARREAA